MEKFYDPENDSESENFLSTLSMDNNPNSCKICTTGRPEIINCAYAVEDTGHTHLVSTENQLEGQTRPPKESVVIVKNDTILTGETKLPLNEPETNIDNFLNKHCDIRKTLSESVRDSWRITKSRIPKLGSENLDLSIKAEELSRNLCLYKHMLNDERTENRNKDVEILNSVETIWSLENQIAKNDMELCIASKKLFKNETKVKKFRNKKSALETESHCLSFTNIRMTDYLNEAKKSAIINEKSLTDQKLETWLLSTCIQDELKNQISELEMRVSQLQSKNIEEAQELNVQSDSLKAHENILNLIRNQLKELKLANSNSKCGNRVLQAIINKDLDEKLELQENLKNVTFRLIEENGRTEDLLRELENAENQKLELELSNRDTGWILKTSRIQPHKTGNRTSGINTMNILMFLLGYDHHLI